MVEYIKQFVEKDYRKCLGLGLIVSRILHHLYMYIVNCYDVPCSTGILFSRIYQFVEKDSMITINHFKNSPPLKIKILCKLLRCTMYIVFTDIAASL